MPGAQQLMMSYGAAAAVSLAQQWANQVVVNGGSVTAGRVSLVNDLITGLQSDGVWTKLDRLWLLAAENTQSALTDLKGLVLATANGSPTFTTDRGYTGVNASSTVYIDTNTNFSTLGGQFSVNSAHASVWSNTNLTSGATGGILISAGQRTNDKQTDILPKYNDGNAYFRIVDLTGSTGTANANSTGQFLANRSDSTHSQGYINGSLFASPNQAVGTAVANVSSTILAAVDELTGISFGSALQASMASYGGSLSGTDVTNFYNRLCTYMGSVFATAWAAQVVANGGTVSAGRVITVGTLIGGLLTDGIWYKLDRLWLFAAENAISALTDLKGLTLATVVNSPAFTTDSGYDGQDLASPTKYISSGFNPGTGTPNYVQNSAHLSAWVVSNVAAVNGGMEVGLSNNRSSYIISKNPAGFVQCVINDPSGAQQTAPATTAGHWIINRDPASSPSTTTEVYQNGSNFASPAQASGGVESIEFYVLCRNNAGSPSLGTPRRIAMVSMGSGLSATEAGNYYTRLRTYMTAVGVP